MGNGRFALSFSTVLLFSFQFLPLQAGFKTRRVVRRILYGPDHFRFWVRDSLCLSLAAVEKASLAAESAPSQRQAESLGSRGAEVILELLSLGGWRGFGGLPVLSSANAEATRKGAA